MRKYEIFKNLITLYSSTLNVLKLCAFVTCLFYSFNCIFKKTNLFQFDKFQFTNLFFYGSCLWWHNFNIQVFLKRGGRIQSLMKPFEFGILLWGNIWKYKFNNFNSNGAVEVICIFLSELWQFVSLK